MYMHAQYYAIVNYVIQLDLLYDSRYRPQQNSTKLEVVLVNERSATDM